MEEEITLTSARPLQSENTLPDLPPVAAAPPVAEPIPEAFASATLIILEGPNAGSTIVLKDDLVVLGQDGGRWLQITRERDGFHALALDPTVMVTRNGSPLPPSPQLLSDGDAVGVAEFNMVFGQSA